MGPLRPETVELFCRHAQNPQAYASWCLGELSAMPPAQRYPRWRQLLATTIPPERRCLFIELSGYLQELTAPAYLQELGTDLASRMLSDLQATELGIDDYYASREALLQVLSTLTDRLVGSGTGEEAIPLSQRLYEDVREQRHLLADEDERHDLVVLEYQVLWQLANLYRQRSDFGTALEWYARAATLAEEYGLARRMVDAQVARADIYRRGGRDMSEALRLILPGWEAKRDAPPDLPLVELTVLLMNTYLEVGDRFEARRYGQTARAQLTAIGLERGKGTVDRTVAGWIEHIATDRQDEADFLGRLFKTLELTTQLQRLEARLENEDELAAVTDYTAVIDQLMRAAATQEERDRTVPQPRVPAAAVLWEKADRAHEREDYPSATAYAEAAYQLGEAADDDTVCLASLNRLMVYGAPSDTTHRLETALRGIAYVERGRRQITTPYQQASYLADKESFYAVAMIDAWKAGNPGTLLSVGELLKGQVQAGPQVDAQPKVVTTIRQWTDRLNAATATEAEELRAERQRAYDKLLLHTPESPRDQAYIDENLARKIQQQLPPSAAVISYYNLSDQVLLIVALTQDAVTTVRQVSGSAEAFARLAQQLVFAPDPALTGLRAPRYVPGLGEASAAPVDPNDLIDWLLPPDIRDLLRTKENWYVCAHRQLHRVPVHALRVDGRYLVEQHVITYLPNLSVLLSGEERWKMGGLAAVATTDYLPREVVLPRLPGTEREVTRITQAYRQSGLPASELLGPDCHRERFVGLLDKWEEGGELPTVLHLALHGEDANGDTPLDARLFLRRGATDGFDWLLRRLPLPLVVLSSCYAGSRPTAGRELSSLAGDDLFGFQAAFFTAGARRVLGALWAVDDRAGAELMVTFHHYLLAGEPPARALALSQRQYLQTAAAERQPPRYWAPFFLTRGR